MSSWSGGQFRVQNELRMDRETIAKGGRRGGPGVRRLKGDGGGAGYRRKGEGVGGERASGMAWTGQHVDYLLLYRSGNNGIPIMKWISLGSQWTSMHASRDPTPPSPPYPIGLLQPTDVHRAGPPSLVHLSDQSHLYPVSQLDVFAWFSRNHRYSTTCALRWKSSLILSRLNIWKIRISNDKKDRRIEKVKKR